MEKQKLNAEDGGEKITQGQRDNKMIEPKAQ